jgi:hypothetical protein
MSVNSEMTALADAIREKSGRTEKMGIAAMKEAVKGISAGIDTSDATATAEDMAYGKTAYVNGKKITGTLSETQLLIAEDVDNISVQDGVLCLSKAGMQREIASGFYATVDASHLGNATTADVAKGKTFTSANGLKLTGTFEGGGGLPSGISALASGTYTPSENKTTRVNVEHGLGVTPNFLVVMMEEDTSSSPLTSALVGETVFIKNMKYNSGSSIQYTVHVTMEGYSSSAQVSGIATRAASSVYFTTTTVGIQCNSTYALKSGYTYRWVCGVMDGIN